MAALHVWILRSPHDIGVMTRPPRLRTKCVQLDNDKYGAMSGAALPFLDLTAVVQRYARDATDDAHVNRGTCQLGMNSGGPFAVRAASDAGAGAAGAGQKDTRVTATKKQVLS